MEPDEYVKVDRIVRRRLKNRSKRTDFKVVDIRNRLGERVWILRERAGLTQDQLGLRVGTSQSRIARIETGNANPTLATLTRIADALDVPVWALLRNAKKRGSPERRGIFSRFLRRSEVDDDAVHQESVRVLRSSHGHRDVRLQPEPQVDEGTMTVESRNRSGSLLTDVAYRVASSGGLGIHDVRR